MQAGGAAPSRRVGYGVHATVAPPGTLQRTDSLLSPRGTRNAMASGPGGGAGGAAPGTTTTAAGGRGGRPRRASLVGLGPKASTGMCSRSPGKAFLRRADTRSTRTRTPARPHNVIALPRRAWTTAPPRTPATWQNGTNAHPLGGAPAPIPALLRGPGRARFPPGRMPADWPGQATV